MKAIQETFSTWRVFIKIKSEARQEPLKKKEMIADRVIEATKTDTDRQTLCSLYLLLAKTLTNVFQQEKNINKLCLTAIPCI